MTLRHTLIVADVILLATCCVSAIAQTPDFPDEPVLAIGDVDRLWLEITPTYIPSEQEVRLSPTSYTVIQQRFTVAGIGLDPPPMLSSNPATQLLPGVRIRYAVLKADTYDEYVFCVQLAFLRRVTVEAVEDRSFFAELWHSEPMMAAGTAQEVPEKLEGAILRQVDQFLAVRGQTQETEKPASRREAIARPREARAAKEATEQQQAEDEPAEGDFLFVASNNSQVFHKPQCPSARKISPENLVKYRSRDEAIQAGKRPCKRCKP